tara:strand:+ start:243 stop:485 length:243 start_codon:yes stop_codon:yes gene_type:complete
MTKKRGKQILSTRKDENKESIRDKEDKEDKDAKKTKGRFHLIRRFILSIQVRIFLSLFLLFNKMRTIIQYDRSIGLIDFR